MALALCLLAPAAASAVSATPAANAGTPVTFPNRIADLSPDGKSMAAYDASNKLCVYDVATQKQRACADLKAKKIALRSDDIVWSPDSTKIAFAERAFEYLIDGDLWVMDAATGRLTDLTDDGYQGTFFPFGKEKDALKGKTVFEDVLPAWSPDSSKIAFSRSPFVNGEQAGNELAVIPAAGGAVTIVTKPSAEVGGVLYWGLAWTPDGGSIAYSYVGVDPSDPQGGLWIVNSAGGTPHRLLSTDLKLGRPIVLAINATGATALILYIDA
ncbi:MAG: DPP IV N-terminal domain-containing protein, partial [Chthoniobacterales bacterium]